jgi:small subunit ribosomal protein S2e
LLSKAVTSHTDDRDKVISMADAAPGPTRGGFGGRGRGGDRGGRGRGRGRRGPRKDEEKEWVPVTKLGRLVRAGKIKSMEVHHSSVFNSQEIYLHSLPIKEYQIVDYFLPKLKDEVMKVRILPVSFCLSKICPVQKQTRAGQRTRFKAFVVIGDSDGHVGLGVKCSKEVATAIRGAMILAKLSVIPVRRGYWGAGIGDPHTVPVKVTGKCGSVTSRLVPAPRGTGIVAAPVPKKVLQLAGITDCYTTSRGSTKTLGNFVKATFAAIGNTYGTTHLNLADIGFLTPDLWKETGFTANPYEEFSDVLRDGQRKATY